MSEFTGNKKLSADFKITFENINKINVNIIKELEKRAAFSEECARILLNDYADFSFFVSLLENEKSKINFMNLKKNMIDENLYLCEYIFKSINFSDLFSAYSVYILSNPRYFKNINVNKKINIKITFIEQFTFNDFLQYLAIYNFEIVNLNYNIENNSINLIFIIPEIKDKINIFTVFCGLLEYYGIDDMLIINVE